MYHGISPGPEDVFIASRPAVDANDVLVWRFGKTDTGNVINEGSGGACPLIYRGAEAPLRVKGPYGWATALSPGVCYASERPAPVNLPSDFTIWAVCRYFGLTSSGIRHLLSKKFANDDTWATPYVAASIEHNGYYRRSRRASTDGTANTTSTGVGSRGVDSDWFLCGVTWNETTHSFQFWVDGVLVGGSTGAADGDNGGNGEWCVGCRHTNDPTENWCGEVLEIRVCDVLRSAAYFEALARQVLPWRVSATD